MLQAIIDFYTAYEPVEHAAVIGGISRYWTEMEPAGVAWMKIACTAWIPFNVWWWGFHTRGGNL